MSKAPVIVVRDGCVEGVHGLDEYAVLDLDGEPFEFHQDVYWWIETYFPERLGDFPLDKLARYSDEYEEAIEFIRGEFAT